MRRVWILAQELKSLGFSKGEAAKALGIDPSYISQLTRGEPGWIDSRRRAMRKAQQAIALMTSRPDDFPTISELAAAVGSTPRALKILLWREDRNFRDLKRGFAVPKHLQAEFTRLGRKHLSNREAGEALGLLGRGEGSMTTGEALRAKGAPNREAGTGTGPERPPSARNAPEFDTLHSHGRAE